MPAGTWAQVPLRTEHQIKTTPIVGGVAHFHFQYCRKVSTHLPPHRTQGDPAGPATHTRQPGTPMSSLSWLGQLAAGCPLWLLWVLAWACLQAALQMLWPGYLGTCCSLGQRVVPPSVSQPRPGISRQNSPAMCPDRLGVGRGKGASGGHGLRPSPGVPVLSGLLWGWVAAAAPLGIAHTR